MITVRRVLFVKKIYTVLLPNQRCQPACPQVPSSQVSRYCDHLAYRPHTVINENINAEAIYSIIAIINTNTFNESTFSYRYRCTDRLTDGIVVRQSPPIKHLRRALSWYSTHRLLQRQNHRQLVTEGAYRHFKVFWALKTHLMVTFYRVDGEQRRR